MHHDPSHRDSAHAHLLHIATGTWIVVVAGFLWTHHNAIERVSRDVSALSVNRYERDEALKQFEGVLFRIEKLELAHKPQTDKSDD